MAIRPVMAAVLLAASAVFAVACGGGGGSGEAFAFRCPARIMAKSALAEGNMNPASTSVTVPRGADRLLLCRYGTRKHPPGPPVRHRLVRDPQTITQTATALNGIPASAEAMPCLEAGEIAIYAVFGYRKADPVVVELRPYGCFNSTNGHVEGDYTVAKGFGPMLHLLGLSSRAR